jgi:hypothetical protein
LLIIGFTGVILQGFMFPFIIYLTGRLSGIFAQRVYDECQFIGTAQCSL